MDNIVVIGGAGFIGRALTAQLVETGAHVTVVSRSAGSRRGTPQVTYRSADVANAAQIREVIAGAQVVYDLSMQLGATWEECERLCVGGARHVAEACLEHGVSRLIYTSTISALYMGKSGSLDESDGPDPNPFGRSFYSRSKILAERMLLEMHAARKLPVVVFRPGIVVGNGGTLVHPALGDRPSATCILGVGSGAHPLPFVLVDDVASALVLAKTTPGIEGKTFNLAGDVRPTAKEYVALLRQLTLRNFRFYPRALWKIGFAEWLRWAIKAAMRKPDNSALPFRDAKSGSMAAQLDCSLAKRLLGWKPVSDKEEFVRRAMAPHLEPIPAGDLRLQPRNRNVAA